MLSLPPLARVAPGGKHILGNLERRRIPAELLARGGHFVGTERGAVSRLGPLLVGGPVADDRLATDQRGARVGDCCLDRLRDLGAVEPVAFDCVPLRRIEAGEHVLVAREIGRAVDSDTVVVPEDDKAAELEIASEPDGFVIDAFHQVAVAGDDVGAVIDDIVAINRVQVPLGDGHSDRHREALPKRPGRDFDSRKLEILGVPGTRASQLAEVADVVDGRLLVTREIEERVDQHRAVTGRQDEPVAVGPVRVLRVELQVACEQRRRSVGHAHRHPGMAAVRGLHRVHRQRPNGVGKSALGRLQVSLLKQVRPSAGFGWPLAAPLGGESRSVNCCLLPCPAALTFVRGSHG